MSMERYGAAIWYGNLGARSASSFLTNHHPDNNLLLAGSWLTTYRSLCLTGQLPGESKL